MRILYFYQYFCTPKGSWGTRVYEFARRWVKAGHEVTVLTSVYDKSDLKPTRLIDVFTVEGIRVIVVNIRLSNKHGILMRGLTFLGYALVASWYALRAPADLVVASSGPLTVAIPGLVAKWFRRKPFIFEVRDLFSEGIEELQLIKSKWALFAIRKLEAITYRSADVTVALSKSMKEWIERDYHPRRVVNIPNASDCTLFGKAVQQDPPEEYAGRKVFLYTGTLGVANHCDQILHAARLLKEWGEADVHLYLIGDGRDRELLENTAKRDGLTNVHFRDVMPKEELATWLAHSRAALTIFRNTRVSGTMSPNKLFDAFAAGVPIIQTTQAWIKDVLREKECGITIDPEDPEALAKAIQYLARNDEDRDRMAANSWRLGREMFDRDLLNRQYLELLDDVAGRRL